MNKTLKWSMAMLSVVAMGCSDDVVVEKPLQTAYAGDDVVFAFSGQNPESRTIYAEPWKEEESQAIYWGNYIADQIEQIKVFCRESHGNVATYNVTPNSEELSSTAASIAKADDDTAIRWGAKGDYDFYAFYPAAYAGDAFVGSNGHVIEASVESGQVPRAYKYQVDGEDSPTQMELSDIANQSGESASKRATIYAMPDMESAIMTAYTHVPAEYDASTKTGYGYDVPLDFKVIADVLDITVNGPVTPNHLGGNGVKREYVKVRSITIKSKNGEILSGKFSLDMDEKTVTPISGDNTILVSTSDEGQYPTLFVRSDDWQTVDRLRVRVFIMPKQITNLKQLSVTVSTDCGDYSVDLGDSEIVSGAIHPIKLNYFYERGIEFDFKQWIGQLDPNIYLSELSIPGTWHSSNSDAQGSDGTDLQAQYDAGIRAFEVHTKNGTTLYTDYTFSTALTAANADYSGISTETAKYSNAFTGGDFNADQPTQSGTNYVRTVTATGVDATVSRVTNKVQQAKYALRLYRTALNNDGKDYSLSDAVKDLASNMNKSGFMFLEFGMDGQSGISGIPVKTTVTTEKSTVVNVTLKGSQSSNRQNNFQTPTLDNVAWTSAIVNGQEIGIEELYTIVSENAWAVDGTPVESTSNNGSATGGEAWTVAVESCLARLANSYNAKTEKNVLYTAGITPNTTIKDVQGQVIVKVNTNGVTNNDDAVGPNEGNGWSGNTPALFSRWKGDSAKEPRTINLKWGAPIAPTPLLEGASDLHWCYTEIDNINATDQGGVSDNQDRIDALKAFAKVSYDNYSEGLHRTFYECAIGGFLNQNATAANYKSAAQLLNPALINILTDPTNKPSPLGFVFMNYAIDSDGSCQSAELIRTIINNNSAFLLQRASDTSTATAAEKTNSSFNANTGNPLK